MKNKVTVKELREHLNNLPDDYEVIIYPKYAEVDGFKKHRFLLENVCEQEPYATTNKDDIEKLIEYFGEEDIENIEDYEVNNHVAIIF